MIDYNNEEKQQVDALGYLLWDYFHHKDGFGITERNDGFIDPEDPKIYFYEYSEWLDVEKKAMKYVKGRRVLDIGCGTGRHALYLQNEKKGFDVLGIDTSPLAIRLCKLQGLKKAEVQSITQFTLKQRGRKNYTFDTILMLGNNFGLFGSFTRARWVLKRFHKMASEDDALIIAQSMDPYRTHEQAHLKYHKLNRMKGRMPGQIRMRVRYKNYKGKWFDYLFVSKQEMENIVSGTGWKIERFLDSTDVPGVYIAIMSSIG
jgi:SAM-dependent methyltransferase